MMLSRAARPALKAGAAAAARYGALQCIECTTLCISNCIRN
jgi:hypothetical protein